MKIVVDSPEDFKAWLKVNSSKTIALAVKTASAEAKETESGATKSKDSASISTKDTTSVAKLEMN